MSITELSPGLLISAPNMADSNFAQSVVLMAEHDEEGAIGFVLNKPTPIRLGILLEGVDEDLAEAAHLSGLGDRPVFIGGPVQRHVAWVLYIRDKDEDLDEGSIEVGDTLVIGASIDTLRAFVTGQRTGPFHVLLGYAGWGEKQLEEEISQGSWLPLELGADFAFDVPPEERWEEAVRRLGVTPGAFLMGVPGAKA